MLLNLRVEAEYEYSHRLAYIAENEQYESIQIGILGQEVEAFKADCASKAKASSELA